MEKALSQLLRGVFLQNFWHDLYKAVGNHRKSSETEAELRLTGLMTSPGSDVAKVKLGQYLQEAANLREKKRHKDALVFVLVSGDYYWRQHQPTRAAGLLLEASDLFYLVQKRDVSLRCLRAALDLMAPRRQLSWWESELIGNIFLLVACLTIIVDSLSLKTQLNSFHNVLSKKKQARLRREDGYRIAVALRRAISRKSLIPIDDLDMKTPLRSRSDYTTLYEHLQDMSERYVIIHDGLVTLQSETQSEAN
ncbi:MAG: hypothetical protein ACFE9D_03815 [Promethearchaeota archaeon]